MSDALRVLVLCTGNSARSQMGEGLLRHEGGEGFEVFSAGTRPVGLNPFAVRAMAEIGIDIAGHRSKSLDDLAGQRFDVVITVCDSARESCPVLPGVLESIHWSLPDPAAVEGGDEAKLASFRAVRDDLRARLTTFIESRRDSR